MNIKWIRFNYCAAHRVEAEIGKLQDKACGSDTAKYKS